MKDTENNVSRRIQRDYNLAFKLSVVGQVEAQKKYGIQGRYTVLVWLRKLGTLDWTQPFVHRMDSKKPTPEQRIKELESLLAQERDRNLVYKTMIDIFEEEHGISSKKSSPKQSKDSGTPSK